MIDSIMCVLLAILAGFIGGAIAAKLTDFLISKGWINE